MVVPAGQRAPPPGRVGDERPFAGCCGGAALLLAAGDLFAEPVGQAPAEDDWIAPRVFGLQGAPLLADDRRGDPIRRLPHASGGGPRNRTASGRSEGEFLVDGHHGLFDVSSPHGGGDAEF